MSFKNWWTKGCLLPAEFFLDMTRHHHQSLVRAGGGAVSYVCSACWLVVWQMLGGICTSQDCIYRSLSSERTRASSLRMPWMARQLSMTLMTCSAEMNLMCSVGVRPAGAACSRWS